MITINYLDFDGEQRSTEAQVRKDAFDGGFYVVGQLGCSAGRKTVRDAVYNLLKGRELLSIEEQ
jgi:hypothetical protein